MSNKTINTQQGHWILAKMGKKVLRPGGKELTLKLVDNMRITSADDIVEFAPGLGFTASIALRNNPKSYTAIELNEAAAGILRKKIKGSNHKIIVGNAADSNVAENSVSKVYGEAMLTMQADHRKSEIIDEAHNILKKDGLYGIHELGLRPDTISEDVKNEIQKALAKAIKVNARPLTVKEWSGLLEKSNFKTEKVITNDFKLLHPKRMIDDEGFFRTLKIIFNILTHPKERKRILAMRKVFKKYADYLCAVAIVAKK
ncbi:MAG: methyltransferase domain-containing protein [Bacteroidota bacterium]